MKHTNSNIKQTSHHYYPKCGCIVQPTDSTYAYYCRVVIGCGIHIYGEIILCNVHLLRKYFTYETHQLKYQR